MIFAPIFSFIFWTSAVLGTQISDQIHSKQHESETKTSANTRNIAHQTEEDKWIHDDGIQKAPSDHYWQAGLLNPCEFMSHSY